ncbi:MAG TPA: hypothetical protein PLW86_01140 [Rhodocyclaceae bacterium]|nr:hypothetical protein [Rhodocyclaceae bacterium]
MATLSQTIALNASLGKLGKSGQLPQYKRPEPTPQKSPLQFAASPSYSVSLSGESLQLSADASVQRAPVVDYTNNIKRPKDKTVSAILAGGNRWWHTPGGSGETPSAVALGTISYSFMSSAAGPDGVGFVALDNSQKQSIRDALAHISSFVNVTFSEVGSGGNISFGSNNQASSAGYARYPNEGGQVFLANNASTYGGSWDPGSYTWMTILHETAHALGLKHPGNYNAGGGGTEGPYLSKALDNRSNTIMSYNNDDKNMKRIFYNGSSFSTGNVTPDSLQMFDIAALQYLYGEASSSATTYSFNEGDIFSRTIWNNNSSSVIDLSNTSSANILDLRGGKFSSIGIRDPYADMAPYFDKDSYAAATSGGKPLTKLIGVPTYDGGNNLGIAKGSLINKVTGGDGSDTVISNGLSGTAIDGGDGDDYFYLTTGTNGSIVGGNGDDTVYVQKVGGAAWSLSGGVLTLTNTKTSATLATVNVAGIEHVAYWNGKKTKAIGVPILASPLENKVSLAYGGSEAPPSRVNETA